MKRLGWKQWLALAVFALVVSVTALFAVRAVRPAMSWRLHHDETIRPWMSIPYVAHTFRVPPHVLYEALGIPPVLHDRRPIRDIARERNRSVDEVISVLHNAIDHERTLRPTGQPPPPQQGRLP